MPGKNYTEMIESIWASDELCREFMGAPKAVLAREVGEIIPDFIDLKVLPENPKLIWFSIPGKPSNWPTITVVPDEPDLKPNEFYTNKERSEAVKTAIANGELGLAQMLRAVVQSYVTTKAWEKDGYMQNLLTDTNATVRQAIADLKLPLNVPADLEFRALEETATRRYSTFPVNPATTEVIGFERALPTPSPRGTSRKWTLANAAAWGYSVLRHGITLPFCGAFVLVSTDVNAEGYVDVGTFPINGGTITFRMPA
ncbi:MAG: hypothetical protein ABI947_09705 [Chloroflexota bacterium]